MAKTREKILEAAWALFSERGFEVVSVRDVTNAAEVNLASVSYHFNGKNGLIQEIVSKALVPLNKHRVRLLKKAGEESGNIENIPLEKIIEAFVRPVVRPEEYDGSTRMVSQIMARSLINQEAGVPEPVMEAFGDAYEIFSIAVASQCPSITPEKAVQNFIFSTGAAFMFSTFTGLAGKVAENRLALNRDDFLVDVIKFSAAGFKSL